MQNIIFFIIYWQTGATTYIISGTFKVVFPSLCKIIFRSGLSIYTNLQYFTFKLGIIKRW